MNKSFVLSASIIIIVSFSAGVFTEIITPSENLILSTQLPSIGNSILDCLKDDFPTVIAAIIFSLCVFSMPVVALMAIGKTFSLGFSAAYILSSSGDQAFGILLAALLPRGIFKIPAYIALVIISYGTAKFVKRNYRNQAALQKGALPYLSNFLLCFLLMAISSILEVLLLQGVL